MAWSPGKSAVLPAELGKEITRLSNAAAADAVEKFRTGMNRLLLSDEKDAKTFFFAEYISWDELIHTRYFDSARFCMLLACAITRMPGFRENSALRDHAERVLVIRWYEETCMSPQAAGNSYVEPKRGFATPVDRRPIQTQPIASADVTHSPGE